MTNMPQLINEPIRADLLPSKALLEVSKVMADGVKKYGPGETWKQQPAEFHLNRALTHLFKVLDHDTTENHLAHAATRLLMALEIFLNPDQLKINQDMMKKLTGDLKVGNLQYIPKDLKGFGCSPTGSIITS